MKSDSNDVQIEHIQFNDQCHSTNGCEGCPEDTTKTPFLGHNLVTSLLSLINKRHMYEI